MKTAISIPDPIFDAAEQLAGQLGISRSELYARAVQAFVEAHRDEDVTAALDRIHEKEEAPFDLVVEQMQFMSLSKDVW